MAFGLLDDQLHAHPKALAAGNAGVGLWLKSISYAGAYLTDGLVPDEWVRSQLERGQRLLPARLVDVGLWHREQDGYRIHNYLEHNPSRAQVEAKRQARAEAGRRGGQANRKQTAKQTGSKPEAKPNPTPIPSRSTPEKSPRTANARARASQIPVDGGDV